MATFLFSALSDGQSINFVPTADVLRFDQTGIAAADLRFDALGQHTRIEVVNGSFAGKEVILADTIPEQISQTNVTFADGSRLLVGDQLSSGVNDREANSITGTIGRDLIAGMGGNDTMSGGDGADVFFMAIGVLAESYGTDSINGGSGFDVVDFTGVARSAVAVNLSAGTMSGGGTGGAGSATLSAVDGAIGGDFNDSLTGNGAANRLEGGAGNDSINGGSGNDTLRGGAGLDTLVGGGGNDQLLFAEAPGSANADQVVGFATGLDKIVLDRSAFAGLGTADAFVAGDARFTAGAGFTSGRDASDRVIYNTTTGQLFYDADGNGAGASQLIATLQGAPALAATDIAATGQEAAAPPPGTIVGTEGNDSLTGTDSNDSIEGRGGNDTLDGGNGADVLRGGSGDDTLIDRHHFDPEAPDTLDGGLGNDTYDLRYDPFLQEDETVIVDAGGIDQVLSNHDFVMPAGIENLTLFEGFGGTGNELDNVIITTSNEPHSYSIDGAGGNDTLMGGIDMDTMRGGAGNDVFQISMSGDPFSTFSDHIVDFVSGTDALRFDLSNFPDLGPAGEFAAGDGRFFAAPGAASGHDASDRMIYDTASGNLFYDADGSGAEEARLIATLDGAPTLLASDITVIGDAPPGAIQGTPGNDSLTGTAGDDLIQGLAGNDTLTGLAGNDTLDAGTGTDRLVGGTGDDTFIVDGTGDLVVENAGEGFDTVLSSASRTLDANVENLRLTGSAAINGNGNALDNNIFGNSADNVLNISQGGADFLAGGAGNDTYVGVGTNDFVFEAAGEGIDTVLTSAGGALRENFENMTLTGTGFIGATGNDLDNRLIGNTGQNGLSGFGGNDWLEGRAGVDILTGGAGRDSFVFVDVAARSSVNHPPGIDEVRDFASGTDELLFENAAFTALGAAGALGAGDARFAAGAGFTSGRDASDRLIYDASTGNLYYDADGSGAGASVHVVTLNFAPSLTATDITVI